MSNQSAEIRKDIRKLVIQQPFFASIILQQKLVVTKAHSTAAVDGVSLFINYDWYMGMNPKERITILAHEVLHITNKHNIRRKHRDHRLWNLACDLAINKHLVNDPFSLPRSEDHKGKYDDDNKYGEGADAEYIYDCLLKEVADKSQQQEDDNPPEDNEENQQEEEKDDTKNQDTQEDNEQDQEQAEGDDSEDASENDSRSPREKAIDEVLDDHNMNDAGQVLDHPLQGTVESEQLEDDVNMRTHKAMAAAKKRGNMPASIEEEIRKDCEPKVRWQDVLSEWIEGRCQSDYNWLEPHEVHLQSDIIMPSMKSEAYGKIIIAIDTSGSMSNEELSLAVSEVFNALNAYLDNGQSDATIQLIYCDSVIHSVETIHSPSQVTCPKGRGGTEFSPVFDYVKKMNEPPMGVIFITDGYCSVYSYDKPSMDVVWLLTSISAKEFKPCFGRCIEVRQP